MANKIHKVAAGETLSIIAKKYATTVEKIAADNKIDNINQIMVGQELKISGVKSKSVGSGESRKSHRMD